MIDTLLEPWPPWVQRPMGIVLRIAGALGDLLFGGLLVFFGYFGATFKQTPPVWGTAEILLVVAGVSTAIAGIAWAVRPCRLTFFAAIGIVGIVMLGGSLL